MTAAESTLLAYWRRPGARGLGLFALLAALLLAGQAGAQSEQLYFVGMEARNGSISADASGTAVYLRWDPVEGELPLDLVSFRVERNGAPVSGVIPAGSVLSSSQIAALYAPPSQSRRAAEMTSALADEASGRVAQAVEDGTSVAACEIHPVTPANFPGAIRNKVSPAGACFDSYWSIMASRLDFNVALARNRGFIDTDILASGAYTYELVGVSDLGTEALLGRIEVTVNGVADLLAGAAQFEQREVARCDGPESAKDHGAVSLFWNYPGANLTELLRDALLTTGYDLYRSDTDPGGLTGLDLGTLALGLGHSSDGSVEFSGLDRVNTRPILISGAPDPGPDGVERDTRNVGWNPPFVQYVDSPEALLAAGAEPGEWRNYYLVARDFSGNYGNTVEIRVQIPDRLAPPAPWDIHTERDSADDSIPGLGGNFEVVWDHVDVRNYYADHTHAHDYCNLETARFDRKLIYASGEDDCQASGLREVDLDIASYMIYRFASPAEAQAFLDSDRDGRADLVERTALPGPPVGLTDPGTACDPAVWPAGAADYRVASAPGVYEIDVASPPPPGATWSFGTTSDGRRQLRWRDTDPNGPAGLAHLGDVFWYAVVAVDTEGNASPLSAPVRGFFPDRTPPLRDGIVCGQLEDCVTWADHLGVYDSTRPFAEDRTSGGQADFIRVGCEDSGTGNSLYEEQHAIVALAGGKRGVEQSPADCSRLRVACNGAGSGYVEFHSNDGQLLDATNQPYTAVYTNGFRECRIPNAFLEEDCTNSGIVPIEPGEALSTPPICEPAPAAPDACISIYRRIGDEKFKVKTHCEPTAISLDFPSSGGEPICLSVVLQDENNVMSAPYYMNCFSLPSTAPIAPPQPLGVTFAPTTATLIWLPPEQNVVGTLLQWRRMDDNSGGAYFYAHAGLTAEDGTLSYAEVDLGGIMASGDPDQQWCFMARSIGSDNSEQSSKWSAELCGLRIPPDETYPEYLPWPVIPLPGELEEIPATYFPREGLPGVLIGEDVFIDWQLTSGVPDTCLEANAGQASDLSCLPFGSVTGSYPGFCPSVRAAVAPRLGFVAYRQSRADSLDLNPSEYHQVSPLIDRIHCWEEARDSASAGSSVVGHLDDPFFELVSFSVASPYWPGEAAVVWVDRTPHEVDREYRYQLVYFSDDGEILGHRTTDWATSREAN
ncbi:MAG: hypothetical protein OSB70_18770 [Myxococcota bacterium]|nr:hypothetical protein [Myxococcota bacterium]